MPSYGCSPQRNMLRWCYGVNNCYTIFFTIDFLTQIRKRSKKKSRMKIVPFKNERRIAINETMYQKKSHEFRLLYWASPMQCYTINFRCSDILCMLFAFFLIYTHTNWHTRCKAKKATYNVRIYMVNITKKKKCI